MRFLVDANLSPRVAVRLRSAGHEVAHVADEGLLTADDRTILAHASRNGQTVVSADADFATLLAVGRLAKPSLVLLRSADRLTPDEQGNLILANLDAVAADVESGAVVSIGRGHLRVRALPMRTERREVGGDSPARVPGTC